MQDNNSMNDGSVGSLVSSVALHYHIDTYMSLKVFFSVLLFSLYLYLWRCSGFKICLEIFLKVDQRRQMESTRSSWSTMFRKLVRIEWRSCSTSSGRYSPNSENLLMNFSQWITEFQKGWCSGLILWPWF